MKPVARGAVVLGPLVSIAAAWRLILAFSNDRDLLDVSFFALLFWAGLFASAFAVWGVLALSRLGTRSGMLLPFEVLAVVLFALHLGYCAYLRVPAVRTLSYSVGRWNLTFGMSRDVPRPTRDATTRAGSGSSLSGTEVEEGSPRGP